MTLSLFESSSWRALWAGRFDAESTGAIFTKSEIVDLILDIGSYRVEPGRRLTLLRVLEPSCGDGAFVSRVVARMIESERLFTNGAIDWNWNGWDFALTASDINPASLGSARFTITEQLTAAGCPEERAMQLAHLWVQEADFLLYPWVSQYHLVVGNPPYVRVENLPKAVLEQYRANYHSMSDRADVYVAFIERGLQLLTEDGRLTFIVANRWTKNAYGSALRALISERYHVAAYLDLAHTQPFAQDVSAYPCIVALERKREGPTYAATLDDIEPQTLEDVRLTLIGDPQQLPPKLVRRFDSWYTGGAPWITTSVDHHQQLTEMSRTLPTLEDSAPGTKVGIGVATGADRVFILKDYPAHIEPDRLLRLAMPGDVKNSGVEWSGRWLLNPFSDDGSLVPLENYPGLRAHLEDHGKALRERHVARNRPATWYRTIDRIWPELLKRDKILMRDIQDPASPRVGVDLGENYPHHNLYYIVSSEWPLHALQCLLRSRRVVSQVEAHSVAMRGGSIRWQAQVLRKLRIPALSEIPGVLLDRMSEAGSGSDVELIDTLANEAYATGGF